MQWAIVGLELIGSDPTSHFFRFIALTWLGLCRLADEGGMFPQTMILMRQIATECRTCPANTEASKLLRQAVPVTACLNSSDSMMSI